MSSLANEYMLKEKRKIRNTLIQGIGTKLRKYSHGSSTSDRNPFSIFKEIDFSATGKVEKYQFESALRKVALFTEDELNFIYEKYCDNGEVNYKSFLEFWGYDDIEPNVSLVMDKEKRDDFKLLETVSKENNNLKKAPNQISNAPEASIEDRFLDIANNIRDLLQSEEAAMTEEQIFKLLKPYDLNGKGWLSPSIFEFALRAIFPALDQFLTTSNVKVIMTKFDVHKNRCISYKAFASFFGKVAKAEVKHISGKKANFIEREDTVGQVVKQFEIEKQTEVQLEKGVEEKLEALRVESKGPQVSIENKEYEHDNGALSQRFHRYKTTPKDKPGEFVRQLLQRYRNFEGEKISPDEKGERVKAMHDFLDRKGADTDQNFSKNHEKRSQGSTKLHLTHPGERIQSKKRLERDTPPTRSQTLQRALRFMENSKNVSRS
eukprot:g560.t1